MYLAETHLNSTMRAMSVWSKNTTIDHEKRALFYILYNVSLLLLFTRLLLQKNYTFVFLHVPQIFQMDFSPCF